MGNAQPVKPCAAVISNLKTNYCIIGFTGMLAGVVFNKLECAIKISILYR